MQRRWLWPLVATLGVWLAGCATVPKGRYGVDRLELEGVAHLDEFALRACLATKERDSLSIDLSRSPAPRCGEPPYDARRLHLRLWRWPWSDWPLYDPSVFERDLARIERWYRARGYYEARVRTATSTPAGALYGTATGASQISLQVSVSEGTHVVLHSVAMEGSEQVEEALGELLLEALEGLAPGDRFDEATYDETRSALLRALRDGGYANAAVQGHVEIDPIAHTAEVRYVLVPGPSMELGDVCVEGHGKLPAQLILQASDLRPGQPYSESDLEDARTRIYQMRVLSEVEITAGRVDAATGASQFASPAGREGEWTAWEDGEGEDRGGAPEAHHERVCRLARGGTRGGTERARVPVEIRVRPAKLYRLGLGAGLQIGVEDSQRSTNAIQQWDLHLFAYTEVRNFLGGLRRLRIEERPKLIFLAPFPRVRSESATQSAAPEERPRLGNTLNLVLEWPAFLEARTLLRFSGAWDRGPDPYGGRFIRDDIDVGLGPSRSFFQNRLRVAAAIHYNPYLPQFIYDKAGRDPTASPIENEKYHLLFAQQIFEWDTRDSRHSPTRGTYARLELHETLPPSNWGYVRLTPELREYFALPYGLVLAARAGLGIIKIYRPPETGTEELKRLGPRPYRLRGGGPYSVRGVQAGALGMRREHTVFPGGTRSWIASLELRIPLGDSFGLATFVDVGDVDGGRPGDDPDDDPRLRFNYPHGTLGAGVRYKTIVGPIRLDVGVLIPGLEGPASERASAHLTDPIFRFRGAVHLTIGEAF